MKSLMHRVFCAKEDERIRALLARPSSGKRAMPGEAATLGSFFLLAAAAAIVFDQLLLLMAFAVLVPAFAGIHRHRQREVARKKCENDFAVFLMDLAGTLKCGHDPVEALGLCAAEYGSQSHVYKAAVRFRRALDAGHSERAALRAFAGESPASEILLFCEVFHLARRHGAPLAEAVRRISRVIRLRQSFERRIRAALGMHRLSMAGMLAIAILIIAAQSVGGRAVRAVPGVYMVGAGVLLVLGGTLWMFKVCRSSLP